MKLPLNWRQKNFASFFSLKKNHSNLHDQKTFDIIVNG